MPLNLIGKQFGELIVIEKSSVKKSNRVAWKCKCSCGNETVVITNHLTSGHTKSCGCLQKIACGKMNPAVNITNQRFGKLIALERVPNKNGKTYWKCKCDCGNYCEVSTNALRTGHTMSCGCINSKGEEKIANWLSKNNIYFERQKSFDDCRDLNTNYLLRFDFFIDNKLLLEYDGITHFKSTGGWNDEEAVKNIQSKDQIKNEWAKSKNIPLYRINYNDIYSEEKLNNILLNLINEKRR